MALRSGCHGRTIETAPTSPPEPRASLGRQRSWNLQVARVGEGGNLGTGCSGPRRWGGRAWRRGPGGKRTLAMCKRSHGRRGQAAPPRRIHDDSPATAPLWPYAVPLPTQALPAKPGQPESAGSRPGMVGVAGLALWDSLPTGGRGEQSLTSGGGGSSVMQWMGELLIP